RILRREVEEAAALEALAPDAMGQHRAFGQRRGPGAVGDEGRLRRVGRDRRPLAACEGGGPVENAGRGIGRAVDRDDVAQIGEGGAAECAGPPLSQLRADFEDLAKEVAEGALAGNEERAALRLCDLVDVLLAAKPGVEEYRDESDLRCAEPSP